MKNKDEIGKNNSEENSHNSNASLTQLLVEKEQARRGKNNRAFLLAHWDEIKEALGAGWNMRAIWELLHSKGRFPGGYDSFVKSVRMEQAKKSFPALKQIQDENVVSKPAQPHKETTSASSGFVFSPDSNRDDLI